MASDITFTHLKDLKTRADQLGFEEFQERRKNQDDLLNRSLEPVFDPRLGTILATYKTPDLKALAQDTADALALDPTRFGATPGDLKQHTKDDMDDAVKWAARTWQIENRDGWIDRHWALGQAVRGIDAVRMLYHPLKLPKAGENNDEYWRNQPHPWFFEPASVMGMSWNPIRKPEIVFSEVEMPVIQASETIKVKGSKLKGEYDHGKDYVPMVDSSGAMIWVGEAESSDYREYAGGKVFKVYTAEYLNRDQLCPVCPDKHPLWCGVEYICGPDGKTTEQVQSYVLPYKHEGTFRLVPGRTLDIYTDPDRMFDGLLSACFAEAAVINWCISQLQTLANRDSSSEGKSIDMSSLPDDIQTGMMEELKASGWLLDKPATVPANKIWVTPGKLNEAGQNISEYFVNMLEAAVTRFAEAKQRISRFTSGPSAQEVAQGTKGANLEAIQQSRLPFSSLLKQTDSAILRIKEDQIHAIRYWEHTLGVEMKFFVTMTGQDNLLDAEEEAGHEVVMTASKASAPFQLQILTKNETLQEQSQIRADAAAGYQLGVLDTEQVIVAYGYQDVKAQMRRLEKEQRRRLYKPINDEAKTRVYKALMSAISDIDMAPAPMPAGPLGLPQPQGQMLQMPQNELPALSRGAGGAGMMGAEVAV